MHGRFVTWFQWAFFLFLSPCLVAMLSCCCNLINEYLARIFQGFLMALLGCTNIAWFICGLIWRFNASGRFACGDQVPEGTDPLQW